VEVDVEGTVVAAHRLVLAAESQFMRGLFVGEHFCDSSSRTVKLNSMEAGHFGHALEFMYTGHCDLEETELQPVLEVACRLQAPALQLAAEAAVCERIDASSSIDALLLADRLSLPNLTARATTLALEHFGVVASSASFKLLPLTSFKLLLRDDRLRAAEEAVFDAVALWLASQRPATPDDDESALLELVRFPRIDKAVMAARVEGHPLVRKHAHIALRAFREAFSGEKTPRTRPRSCDHWVFSRRLKGSNVEVSSDGCVLSHPGETEGDGRNAGVFGEEVFTSGRHRWSMRCDADPEHQIAWGVVEDDADPDDHFTDGTAHTALYSNGGFFFRRGMNVGGATRAGRVQPGDVIEMDLDMDAGTFRIGVRGKHEPQQVASNLAGKRLRAYNCMRKSTARVRARRC
jgi:hypothetical protein